MNNAVPDQTSATGGWVEEFAPAKINLSLHVTGRREDGYHLLDSLVAFADIGDTVRVRRADTMSLSVSGPLAAGVPDDASNLVCQAAELIGGGPFEIALVKRLPSAAGIGGGSSDAAAALRAIGRATGRPLPDTGALLALGADVPVCTSQGFWRTGGIGDTLTPWAFDPITPPGIVLANPRRSLSTAKVFGALSHVDGLSMPDTIPRFRSVEDLGEWLTGQRNDLEISARELMPEINIGLNELRTANPCLARMSGSGATLFALFPDTSTASDAANHLRGKLPTWWVESGGLVVG